MGSDHLVLVCHKSRETIVVDRGMVVWVSCHNRELHGGGNERRSACAEIKDCSAHQDEFWLVGTVD